MESVLASRLLIGSMAMVTSRRAVLGLFVALGCAGAPAGREALTPGAAVPANGGPAVDTGAAAFVYVGLAGGEIALFHLDAATGTLARGRGATAGRAPAALVRSVERGTLVAVDGPTGQATSFSIDPRSGGLRLIGRATTGAGPAAGATLDDTGRY